MIKINSEKIKKSRRIKLLLAILTTVIIFLMFPKGESLESKVTVGSIWIENDLISSLTFPVLKDQDLYEDEIQKAEKAVNNIFIKDEEISGKSVDELKTFNKRLNELLDETVIPGNNARADLEQILSPETVERFIQMKRDKDKNRIFVQILNYSVELLQEIYLKGIINQSYQEIQKDSIFLKIGKTGRNFHKKSFFDSDSAVNYIKFNLRNRYELNNDSFTDFTEYITNFVEPNIIFDQFLTNGAVKNAKDMISPNIGIVNENERIVAKHDRITFDIKQKIDSYRIAKGEQSGLAGRIIQGVGKFIHIAMLISLYAIYLFLFRKKVFENNSLILLISLIILFVCALTYLLQFIDLNVPLEFLVLLPVASMLFTIIFDSRMGFYATIVIALIIGGLKGNDYVFAVMNIIAGALASYTVRDIKNRRQIFRSFLFIFIGYMTGIIAFGFERFATWDQILLNSGFAFSNAVISPVITFGMIIFIERFFKVTTDLTLLELTDFNHPLLRELSRNAPGTFTHSITMGSLVESAAESIDANPLLARVGAYYHDIGKSFDPGVFVENLVNSENIHEKLEPEKSAEMIVAHVVKGIQTAEKLGIPPEITDFIPMHHGTMKITFFYEKAKESMSNGELPDESKFRYPGPKPNTKETALVMLADACESAVRSMPDPDPKKIENLVSNLIQGRIDEGQLDESPLTFNDIRKIREVFISILISQHHKRIRYPNQEEMENEKQVPAAEAKYKPGDTTYVSNKSEDM